MTIFLFVLGFVLGSGAILFAIQNNEMVALTYFGWQFESSLALLIIIAVGVGMLIAMFAFLPSALSGSLRIMGLKRENKKLAETVVMHEQVLAGVRPLGEAPPPLV